LGLHRVGGGALAGHSRTHRSRIHHRGGARNLADIHPVR